VPVAPSTIQPPSLTNTIDLVAIIMSANLVSHTATAFGVCAMGVLLLGSRERCCKSIVISGAHSAPGGSSSLPFRFHIARNRSCCTATADCLFAPYSSIYTLVALVSYIDQDAIH
jgi:hypothetical protein